MAADNYTILSKVWLNATNDFQQRVPMPTQQTINETVEYLFDPMNRQYFNQFLDILVNRIGMTYVRNRTFSNPLSPFKKGKLSYGNTVQEIATGFIRAHAYEDDADTLLKVHKPQVAACYHAQNRRDYYPLTTIFDELRSAFDDNMGLNNFLASLMAAPENSDEYDEMNIMLNLIGLYENKWGFYNVHLDAPITDEVSGKQFLTEARALAGRLRFPSTLYNADITKAGLPSIPVFVAEGDELILITTPEVQANLDVNTLAVLFNVDKAEVNYRTVLVPEIPIPGSVAILTTTDFFQCWDTNYQMTSFYNPQTLATNYYLHHWGIYSASPFVPAINFTTGTATVTPVANFTATGLTLTADSTTVEMGGTLPLKLELQGNFKMTPDTAPVPDTLEVKPDTATWAITATDVEGEPLTVGARTRIDEYGVLHVQGATQGAGLGAGSTITITAKAAYVNPDGDTPDLKPATLSVTIP